MRHRLVAVVSSFVAYFVIETVPHGRLVADDTTAREWTVLPIDIQGDQVAGVSYEYLYFTS